MAEIIQAPVPVIPVPGQTASISGVVSAAPVTPAAPPSVPAENRSETLYIQNLNEKIKLPGIRAILFCQRNFL
jgi:hypothetical protein